MNTNHNNIEKNLFDDNLEIINAVNDCILDICMGLYSTLQTITIISCSHVNSIVLAYVNFLKKA